MNMTFIGIIILIVLGIFGFFIYGYYKSAATIVLYTLGFVFFGSVYISFPRTIVELFCNNCINHWNNSNYNLNHNCVQKIYKQHKIVLYFKCHYIKALNLTINKRDPHFFVGLACLYHL